MSYGKLYLVGTPIGNLQDITLRALDTLKKVDVIAAEDTRQTVKLLNYFKIKKKLITYHKFNESERSEDLIKKIKSGLNIAIVTDAGMPGISDPGEIIVKKCIKEGVEFEVVPGVTASVTALIYSGLNTSEFIFKGFIPRNNKEKQIMIDEIKDRKETLIFYEAPHRIKKTLIFLKENLNNRRISICREITKLHEQILRLDLEEALKYYENVQPKGEYVIVVEGKSEREIDNENKAKWENISIEEHIKQYINKGLSKKDAIKQTAKDRKMSKSEVYKHSLEI